MTKKLPDFFSSNKWQYILIAMLGCIIYWPLCTGLFSLKNDAYIYFLPWRYHISEAIQNGNFPFWNPYLYTGLPLYSDIQSGAWNPVVLTISLFTRYNMHILQWELLFYIILGGIGMHKLIRQTGYSLTSAFFMSIVYMCCGFITSNGSFIPWITCAGFLPFAILYFHRLLTQDKNFLNSIKLAIALFFMLVAGYPSFLIYLVYIFIAVYIFWFIKNRKNKEILIRTTKGMAIASFLFLVLSSPALLSFYDFMPYYKRGSGAGIDQALSNPFTPFCSISYLLPTAVAKPHDWMNTDIAMRNAYIGIFTLAFLVTGFTKQLSTIRIGIIFITVFSYLFSLGDFTPIRKFCYDFLPLMDTFRHPATIRIFTTIGLLLLTAPAIDSYINQKNKPQKKLVLIFLILIGVFLVSFLFYYSKGLSATHSYNNMSLKQAIDSLSFNETAVIVSVIQIIFLIIALLVIKKPKKAVPLMLLNVVLFAWMAFPFTLISQKSSGSVDQFISSFPKSYPKPSLKNPVDKNFEGGNIMQDEWDLHFFYNKRIEIQDHIVNPTISTAYHQYLSDTSLRYRLMNSSFAFFSPNVYATTDSARLTLDQFTPGSFTFLIDTKQQGYLTLFQQFHHRWKGTVNGIITPIDRTNIAFMQVKIPAGKSVVRFSFEPGKAVRASIIIAFSLFPLLLFILLYKYWKTRNNNEK